MKNAEQPSDLVGTWRSYLRDSSGVHFGFTIYKADGSIAISTDPQAAPTVIGSVSFANGIATVTTSSTDAMNCVSPGKYEMRLIRMGEQPVALTYHELNQEASDLCFGRVNGFVQPMIYYSGSAKDLPAQVPTPSLDTLAQPLVPCFSLTRPCDFIATEVDDLNGYWKTYFAPAPGGVAFAKFTDAGVTALTGDDVNTATTFFPLAPGSFERALYASGNPTNLDECGLSVDYMRVIKFGKQQVALQWTAVADGCASRRDNFSDAMIWIKGL